MPPKVAQRPLITLLSLCGLLILLLSVETLFLVKDVRHFEAFARQIPGADFAEYVNARLFTYLLHIFPVFSVGLYTYFLVPRLGTPPLYRIVWGLLIGASAAFRAVQTSLRSPLSIVILIVYAALLLVVINIHRFKKEGDH